jgi:FkbM family methyltransferase
MNESIRKHTYKKLRHTKWALERAIGEKTINRQGLGFINFIDVGAAGWLPKPWRKKNAAKIHHVLRFEPQEKNKDSENVTTLGYALWKNTETKSLFTFGGETGGASLFEQNYDFVQENFNSLSLLGDEKAANTWFVRSKVDYLSEVKCRTLDDVIADISKPFNFHFLKIDAQGAEYEILLGAEKLLKTSCIGIQAELFVKPLLKGIKLLPEVVVFLDNLGFDLVKQFPAHGTFASQH